MVGHDREFDADADALAFVQAAAAADEPGLQDAAGSGLDLEHLVSAEGIAQQRQRQTRRRRIQPDESEDLERIARYIIRNPFSTEKMEFKPPIAVNRDGTVIYRSGMNPGIHRNFQIFTPCDFIAAITQHIPGNSFQLLRYYGWYSKNMRGQRKKRDGEEKEAEDVGEDVDYDTEPVLFYANA